MEITGTIEKILQPISIKSTKGDTNKYSFILKTNGQYSKRLYLEVWGEDKWNALGVREGANVSVSFDIESKEWREHWFTTC